MAADASLNSTGRELRLSIQPFFWCKHRRRPYSGPWPWLSIIRAGSISPPRPRGPCHFQRCPMLFSPHRPTQRTCPGGTDYSAGYRYRRGVGRSCFEEAIFRTQARTVRPSSTRFISPLLINLISTWISRAAHSWPALRRLPFLRHRRERFKQSLPSVITGLVPR